MNVKGKSPTGVASAVKALLKAMGPAERLYVDSACTDHAPLLWLLPGGPVRLIDECLTCWMNKEFSKMKSQPELPWE